jgi:hypothetical protein
MEYLCTLLCSKILYFNRVRTYMKKVLGVPNMIIKTEDCFAAIYLQN